MSVLYALTIEGFKMPWWGWAGESAFAGGVVMQCRLWWQDMIHKDLERKHEIWVEQLSYVSAMTIKYLGQCGCHPWDKCKLHGDLEFRIHADERVAKVLEAANLLETAKFAKRFRSATEDEEFLRNEEDKRRRKAMAQAEALKEQEERDKRETAIRDRLARENEAKREYETLAHAAAEAKRVEVNEHRATIWERIKEPMVEQFLGVARSSPPRDEGGGSSTK